jgi:hypothetical protein
MPEQGAGRRFGDGASLVRQHVYQRRYRWSPDLRQTLCGYLLLIRSASPQHFNQRRHRGSGIRAGFAEAICGSAPHERVAVL